MGGGKSQSETQTDQSTKVTTNTTTTIDEIGLIGEDAVELANIVQTGATLQATSNQQVFTELLNGTLKGFEQIGTASKSLIDVQKTPTQLVAENAPLIVAAAAAFLFVWQTARKR